MGSNGPFAAQVEIRNGVARVAIAGELDIATVPQLEEHLTEAAGAAIVGVMVDLREVTFIDSCGLHAFFQASSRAEKNGHRFLLIGASAPVRRLFEITETTRLFDDQEAVSLVDQFVGTGRRAVQWAFVDGDSGV